MRSSQKGQIGDGCSFPLLKLEVRTSNEIINRLVQTGQKRILFCKLVNKTEELSTMGCTEY